MKFSMIFEGVDKASKVMRKLMAAEKKMAAANKGHSSKAQRANQRQQKSIGKISRAMTGLKNTSTKAWNATVTGAKKAGQATTRYYRRLKVLSKAGFKDIKKGDGRIGRSAALATGILASVYGGAALAAGSMVDVASAFERYETILISSTGSQEKARKAMGWVTTFAATTPYELDQVTEGFVALKNYGIDPTNGTLRSLGDTAAAMGKPLMQAVEAMADAVTGENERLKEFGITAAKTGDKITYAYTNAAGESMKATVKASDRAGIQIKLMEIFNEKFGGSMTRLSATWSGMVSNMSDMWMKFQLAIMNAGLFDWMKSKLKLVLDTINKMEADGSLEVWAKNIGQSIKDALVSAWEFGKGAYEVIKTLSGYMKTASEYVGGWKNLSMILGAMAFGPTLVSTAIGIVQIANGLRLLSLGLFANPIGLAVAAIAAGVYLIYRNWDAIKPYFIAIWEGIKTAFSTAWDFIKAAFGWTPLGIIIANWDGISAALSSPLEIAKGAIDLAWSAIKLLFDWSPAVLIYRNWDKISSALSAPVELAFSAVSAVWDKIKSIFDWSPMEAIEKNFGKIGEKVSGFISGAAEKAGVAWAKLKGIFSSEKQDPIKMALSNPQSIDKAVASTEKLKSGLTAVDGLMDQLNSKMATMSWHSHGQGLMNTLAAGILANKQTVINAVDSVAQSMRDHLPSSPAKTGPLSDIHKLKFAETIAGSIKAGPMVKAMQAATAATMAVAGPGAMASPASAGANVARSPAVTSAQSQSASGGASITYSPTIHLSGDAANAKQDFAKQLKDHSIVIEKIITEQMRLKDRRKH